VAQLNDAGRRRLAPRSLRDEDLLALLPQLGEPPEPPERSGPAGADVLIDVAALQRALSSAHPPAILDVRWALGDAHGHRRYLEAHIPTAVYVDLDRELAAPPSPAAGRHPLPAIADLQAAAQRWGIRRGQPVVVYDDSGGLAAARAWWLLRWAGIAHVQLLDGAFGAWVAAGLPVQSGAPAPAPEPGDVTLTGGGLAVLSADESAALPDHGILLDARAPERFRGEVEPVDPRAGHIPGARNAPAAASLDGERRFLGAEALRIRFAQLGVGDDQPVGVYCGSGVTAAHLIAALQIAGIDAALYPGSWSAWSADPDRPVATEALVR
jgi:thiosulfate/3-mercaptopyruvate sulfurtransferase